ncbi:MAG TPA: ATP-binding protein [Anaerolineae bacterium]|nr:ATP-binding protein [Anaerolineae bacterium]
MIAIDSRSSSSIPVRYYFISLLLPLSVLLVLRAVPQIDLNFNVPAAHFYIVTAISFSGIILAGLAISLSRVSGRAQILFVSLGLFSVAGLLFIHGLATPNALLVGQTPGSGWAAKLSLTVVGIFLILSGIPWRSSINDLLIKRDRLIILTGWIVYGIFFFVVFLFPARLAVLNQSDPTIASITLFATIAIYVIALILYVIKLRAEHHRLDAFITIGLLIFGAAVAMQSGGLMWHISWWLYYFLIGLAVIIITIGLNDEYGHRRPASLLRNYLVFGLSASMVLSLIASELFYRINRDNLTHERQTTAVVLAQHLVFELNADLPQTLSEAGLQSLAADPQALNLINNHLAGLNVPQLKVYDTKGQIVFSTANFTAGQAQADTALLSALKDQPVSQLDDGTQPEFPNDLRLTGQVLETYVPLKDSSRQIIGALEIYQAADDLAALAIQQRGQFLITVSILMLLLFVAFAFIVQHADRLIAARSLELSAAHSALQQSERTRQDITNVVINNVQRPMSTLARSIEQLQRSELPPEQIELASRVRSHARDVNNTVYNLLNISEMENGELHVQQSTFSIDELLHTNVQDSAEAAHEAEVSLVTEARPGLPYVWADRELINRVINNLLGNAITHTPPGGQVVLNADADPDGNIIVRVKDQGEGIALEDQAHIFEKFARIGGESSSDGTGLGLAFCKLAVEQHQGRIWVESEPGHSSTFSFTLPTLTTATAI